MNEEILQRGYVVNGKIKGDPYGKYERFELGGTNVGELQSLGYIRDYPQGVDFPFELYNPPKPKNTRPDGLFCSWNSGAIQILANKENKKPSELNTEQKRKKAFEQGLYSGALVGSKIAIVTDETQYFYIDIQASLETKNIVLLEERISLTPGLLEGLCNRNIGVILDPAQLAEKVWQAIWHATKEEPKACLLTFVEIFILKFLSDNLPSSVLAKSYTFYELSDTDSTTFKSRHGKTQIEYYVQTIRPEIKRLFPDKTSINNESILNLLGLGTIVSPTSIINGFAFLRSSSTNLETFNRTFLEILGYFKDFGYLTRIEPEFKMRLYETFLKKSARQQKLGQFFTPRNVVKSIIRMARLDKLKDGDLVLDPAAGVGGFILEPLIDNFGIQNNISFSKGSPKQRIRFLGLDVDIITHILAKANTLLHLAEFVRDEAVTVDALNTLMAELFLLVNSNEHLGTLEYPIKNKASVIMTNPPYVTQGSQIYKQEIKNVSGLKNGLDLKDYYDRCGLGLESLFLRYISGALKPGGRAFVIVPYGMLTRSESTMKEKILSECNVLASIALPRNTFFNTAQKTYLLAVEKRHTTADVRPDVFCAIASSIGESLDARRISTPDENDLQDIAEAFVSWDDDKSIPNTIDNRIKIVNYSEFSASDRWDVVRFWDDAELVGIGERDKEIDTPEFLSEIKFELQDLVKELATVESNLQSLTQGTTNVVNLGDEHLFTIRRGKRVTRKMCDDNPGNVPVYSGSKIKSRPLGKISIEFAEKNGINIENCNSSGKPIITINANGAVGYCFVRRDVCVIHDDVMIVDVLSDELDFDFLEGAIRKAVVAGNYEYEAKLYNRVKELEIAIPVTNSGKFDLEKQKAIAKTQKLIEGIVQRISEIGKYAEDARLK